MVGQKGGGDAKSSWVLDEIGNDGACCPLICWPNPKILSLSDAMFL